MRDQGPQTASEGKNLGRAQPERPSWWTPAVLFVAVMVLLGMFGAAVIRHQHALAIGRAVARGEAPAVPAVTLPALDGPAVSLSGLRGHPVLLNFWASWCIPCRDEAPLLEKVWTQYRRQGLLVIGVDTQDMEGPARSFIQRFHITYPTLRDPDGAVARRFGTTGVPETFFIDADGRIRGKFPGVETRDSAWREAVLRLLGSRASVQ